jgi:NADH dehydrogenase/NADH:ubiquinone oxidoreductase subunit G
VKQSKVASFVEEKVFVVTKRMFSMKFNPSIVNQMPVKHKIRGDIRKDQIVLSQYGWGWFTCFY